MPWFSQSASKSKKQGRLKREQLEARRQPVLSYTFLINLIPCPYESSVGILSRTLPYAPDRPNSNHNFSFLATARHINLDIQYAGS